jgi:hypothetical protein
MIDPVRTKLLQKLAELIELAPDYRFGQMICNLAHLARGGSTSDVWDVEDAELLAALEQHIVSRKGIREKSLIESP